jgi:hypothetical protein
MLNQFLFGAIFFGFALASLFFLRFWKKSHDPLFLLFALAFALLASERIVLAFVPARDEFKPYVYLIRLSAYALILAAIMNKNRRKGK